MNPILFGLGIPVGAILGLIAQKLEKHYKGKSDTIRGLSLGLPFALFTLTVILIDVLL